MAKKFLYRGKTQEELENMTLEEFSKLLTSRERRVLKRGFTQPEKKLLEDIRQNKSKEKMIKTHVRDMIILPEMIGVRIGIYNGKEFKMIVIDPAMIGH